MADQIPFVYKSIADAHYILIHSKLDTKFCDTLRKLA